jgi:adenine-specific DNA-methyltransferase
MKYMGSKRSMLTNGLGEMLLREAPAFDRVVDLFCGAAAISRYVARSCDVPVLAVDLQHYATALANAVISRTTTLDANTVACEWLPEVERLIKRSPLYKQAREVESSRLPIPSRVATAKALCSELSLVGPTWNAYGGHYYSPTQALVLDYLRRYLPTGDSERAVCLGATLVAASKAASSPGHTAQPFATTETAGPFIEQCWKRDILTTVRIALRELCAEYAKKKGDVRTGDAVTIAGEMTSRDLVVVDPPYSAVQYSRFYHVLETISLGNRVKVSGRGRYPPPSERPQSDFSKKTTSHAAFERLLQQLGEARSSVIVTFPAGICSNAVSGDDVMTIAKKWFRVEEQKITGEFSTLGGNNTVRDGRQPSLELLLLLRPHTSRSRKCSDRGRGALLLRAAERTVIEAGDNIIEEVST